jgi:hypothetical protein
VRYTGVPSRKLKYLEGLACITYCLRVLHVRDSKVAIFISGKKNKIDDDSIYGQSACNPFMILIREHKKV